MNKEKVFTENLTFTQDLFKENSWINFWAIENNDKKLCDILSVEPSHQPQKTLDKNNIFCLFVVDFDEAKNLNVDINQAKELLNKMINAMNIQENQFLICETKNSFEKILEKSPIYVVPMGAKATQFFLDQNSRLTKTHGQFYPVEKKYKDQLLAFQVFPLFHPEYLIVNPSMKKTQWEDLKKLIKNLT